jgi:hypothetical protein
MDEPAKTIMHVALDKARKALAALDTLAAEQCLTCGKQCPNDCLMDKPSEDIVSKIRAESRYGETDEFSSGYTLTDIEAAALIESDRQKVREECAMHIEQMVKDAWNQGYETCWASRYAVTRKE